MSVTILIPAAGFGRRMGSVDKLLITVKGEPLIRRAVRIAGQVAPVLVTVPTLDHARAKALSAANVRVVAVPDNSEGMAASLRRGIAALPSTTTGVMIVPGDMPDLAAEDYRAVIEAFEERPDCLIQATTEDGQPGHPVIFPKDCFGELRALKGDEGARSVLKAHKHRLKRVSLPECHAMTDLDTPEAWFEWRAVAPDLRRP